MRDWKRLVVVSMFMACAAVVVLPALAQGGKASCAELARRGGFADAPYTCVEKGEVVFDAPAQVRRTRLSSETATMMPEGIKTESTSTSITEVVNGRMTSDDPELSRQFGRYPNLVTLRPGSSETDGGGVSLEAGGARVRTNLENCACAGCRTYHPGDSGCSVASCDTWCCVCIGAS